MTHSFLDLLARSQALSYIDPGGGSLLAQVIIAGIVACTAFCTNWTSRLGTWLRRVFRRRQR